MALANSSIDPEDVARFSALADRWWDVTGPFAPLPRFNPVRLGFIRDRAAAHFGRDIRSSRPFDGLRLLDIGCGGGLLSEPMTRLGFEVTGVDASQQNIQAASAHAEAQGLRIDYRASTAEALLEQAHRFDVVLNMEVIEHVADPRGFLINTARLMKPGGVMIVATLNRTLKSLALAKVGAEYVLRWVPGGPPAWSKSLPPDEIRQFAEGEPLHIEGPFGVEYEPLKGVWREGRDASVNYMMVVTPA